jgi:16S rRNA (adenine1518-N6/adenine1519-N6)-dimethyltransferase
METKHENIPDKESEAVFFRVVRAAFNQRRKTLANALYAVFNESFSKERITEIVVSCGFDARIRGEMLSIEDFIKLSSHLSI